MSTTRSLGAGGKVQELLEFGHRMDLTAALERVHPFLRGDHDVAVEVRGALLELREILDSLQRALRSEEALHVHSAQGRRVDATAEGLWPDVANQVSGSVRVSVGVTIEASDAQACALRTAIVRREGSLRTATARPLQAG